MLAKLMAKVIDIEVQYKRYLADIITPVACYLKVRDRFPGSLLLESSDYRGTENSFSFICCNPIAMFKVEQGEIEQSIKNGKSGEQTNKWKIQSRDEPLRRLEEFVSSFNLISPVELFDVANGFFGYASYEAVQYFEEIDLGSKREYARDIPEIRYAFFEFIIAFNHFRGELFILRNSFSSSRSTDKNINIEDVYRLITGPDLAIYPFSIDQEEQSNLTDSAHIEIIEKCKKHIMRGDVFQIVPSRRFSQSYRGDDFNVYRALRSINPSPYLYYFDYGDYRIFGSSPEAQLVVKDERASIYPIAGTYPRRADRSNDLELAESLRVDPKEAAEHVMLVDLARNDLSRHCKNVRVDVFKEAQFYSHVIHLVSKVSGELRSGASSLRILADTFPAGTLSGAPKFRAMELIDRYEVGSRSFYGGCLGFISPSGFLNHAIMIRSFLSKGGVLYSQAGGGVVADSDPKTEVQEVKNKLGALKRALQVAEQGGV